MSYYFTQSQRRETRRPTAQVHAYFARTYLSNWCTPMRGRATDGTTDGESRVQYVDVSVTARRFDARTPTDVSGEATGEPSAGTCHYNSAHASEKSRKNNSSGVRSERVYLHASQYSPWRW